MNILSKVKIKVISTIITIAMVFTCTLPPTAFTLTNSNQTTLQVQSIFKPILDVVGSRYTTQIQVELSHIIAIAQHDISRPWHDINGELDEWISKANIPLDEEVHISRWLDVISHPRKTADGIEIYTRLTYGPDKGTVFRISTSADNLNEIFEDPRKLKIKKLDIAELRSKGLAPPNLSLIPAKDEAEAARINNLGAYRRLCHVLRTRSGKDVDEESEPLMEELTGQESLPYPDGVNVAIFLNNFPGLELAGRMAAQGEVPNVNFLYILPLDNLFLGKSNPDMVFVSHAVFVDKNGKIRAARFKNPVPIHALTHSGMSEEARKFFEEKNIPTLNSTKASALCLNKSTFDLFASTYDLPTSKFEFIPEGSATNIQQATDLINASLLHLNNPEEIVIKPNQGARGKGVKMFTPQTQMKEAAKHLLELSHEPGGIIIETRIPSKPWYNEDEERLDWNLRVLATWDGDKVVVNEKTCEVRYGKYGPHPVNKTLGADVIRFEDFMKTEFYRTQTPDLLEKVQGLISKAMHAMKDFTKSKPGFIGWDLILDENGNITIIEANGGTTGGIPTIEKLTPSSEQGQTAKPFFEYMRQMGQEYKDQDHETVITDQPLEILSLMQDSGIYRKLANVYFMSGEYLLAERFYKEAIETDPDHDIRVVVGLADSLFKQEKYYEAEQVYRQALELDKWNKLAEKGLRATLSEQGIQPKAIEAVIAAYRKDADEIRQAETTLSEKTREKTFKKKLQNIINSSNKRSQQLFHRVERYLQSQDTPIDIPIDLSLIPRDNLQDNIETLAVLILLCKDLKVNFRFEMPNPKNNGSFPEALQQDIDNSPDWTTEVRPALIKAIEKNAARVNLSISAEEFVAQRINTTPQVNAIEVPLWNTEWLVFMRDSQIPLKADQYPVALSELSITSGGICIRNFEAALNIGLAKAALAIARKTDEKRGDGQETEFLQLIRDRDLLKRIGEIYKIFRDDVEITEDSLRYMVHPVSRVRLNRAIEFFLPPIVRMLDKLNSVQRQIHLVLQSA